MMSHLHETLWCLGSEGHWLSCNYDIILYIDSPTSIFAISQWVHACFLSYWIGSDTILVPLYGREEARGTCLIVPSQFPYLCQTGVCGAYLISRWGHVRFLSYCIVSNTILVSSYGRKETRGTHLIILSQFPYLCQTGVWGAYLISQWVHIHFLSYCIGSNTTIVPLYGSKETRGTHLNILWQFPYLCQKGVWGAYVISQWVQIPFLSYLIGFKTILVPHHGPKGKKWMHLTVLFQSPYLCQKGVWGGHAISWW
jgi:hypothetical protein